MVRKIALLTAFFCLIFSGLCFAQTENPYLDFNPESLKSNKDYIKNFAPNNFSQKILYSCMHDMLDAARSEYAFLPPFKTDEKFDSTAMMQGVYQAQKEEKTVENLPPYRTTAQRLRKYGLGSHGVELVSKAKATLGDKEYSYYDLCLEVVRPILKNLKTAAVLLDRQYSYVGFGYEFDQYMKYMYVSFILGNDRTFNYGKPATYTRDVPYTTVKYGLSDYDEQLCKKCMTDKSLEILSSCLSVKDGTVYFSHDDYKVIKKIIGKEGDAIVLDFVQHSQYQCDGADKVDQDRPNHGYMTKNITFEQMLADNEATGKKTLKLLAPIATIPEEIPEDADIDINIIIVKDGKYVCRNVIKNQVECKKADYKEKMLFLKDETSIKATGEWVPVSESNTIKIKIPIVATKTTYTYEDLREYFEMNDEPAYTIDNIQITASNSVNYIGDATAQKNQKARAESIANAIKSEFKCPDAPTEIKYDDGWEQFTKDIVFSEEYYDLGLLTKQAAVAKLKANGGKLAKVLDTAYLAKERFILVTVSIKYKVDGEYEQEFVATKFNRILKAKKVGLAMAIQQYMIKQVEKKNYSSKAVEMLEIPNKVEYQALLINKQYMLNLLEGDVTERTARPMLDACKLNMVPPIAQYNKVMADVAAHTPFTSNENIVNRQAAVDKLYSLKGLPQDKVNDLNLEFQIQILDYLKAQPASTENVQLMNNTYNKIKEIRNPVMSSWQNAYKLASIFVKNGDYVYAVELMEPFLKDKTISNDFLFSFISLSAVREELYMSANFTLAVQMASERDAARLCGLFDKLPVIIFDNQDVKKIICKTCK